MWRRRSLDGWASCGPVRFDRGAARAAGRGDHLRARRSAVPEALRVVAGGIVVCAGIHMSDIPAFPYRLLWEERVVRSVANLTRLDAREFLGARVKHADQDAHRAYALADANRALANLRAGRVEGAAVLVPSA